MAAKPPTKKERDSNLDELKKAVDQWAQKEQVRLENEVKFMRLVLQGRSASQASSDNLAELSLKLIVEINQFLLTG